MNDIKELKDILNTGSVLSNKSISRLKVILKKYDAVPENKNCSDCWRDAALVLLSKLKEDQNTGLLKDYVNVIYCGRLVNNEVMTEELATWLKENRFPKKYYREDFE